MPIRPAKPEEAAALAKLARLSKATWGYPQAQLEAWSDELTPGALSIRELPTWVAEEGRELAAFYQLRIEGSSAELLHFWVHPDFQRRGIGRALMAHATGLLARHGVATLEIDADPGAEPFYRGCGASRVGEIPAPVEGEPLRVRPQLRITIRG